MAIENRSTASRPTSISWLRSTNTAQTSRHVTVTYDPAGTFLVLIPLTSSRCRYRHFPCATSLRSYQFTSLWYDCDSLITINNLTRLIILIEREKLRFRSQFQSTVELNIFNCTFFQFKVELLYSTRKLNSLYNMLCSSVGERGLGNSSHAIMEILK